MVFVGNINQSVDTLVKTSHLFAPFPETMIDSAFFDRFHSYVPGWEIPKMRPEFFTNQYGMIVDYLAEWQPEGDDMRPSPEGLARTLSEIVLGLPIMLVAVKNAPLIA